MLNWTSENATHTGDLEILPFVATPEVMMKLSLISLHPVKAFRAIRSLGLKASLVQAQLARMPFIVISLMRGESRGAVSLSSSNPADPPEMNWNIFSEPGDSKDPEAVRTALRVFNTKAMKEIGGKLVGLDHETVSDDKRLDEWIMSHLFVLGHPSGTCKMGPASDEMAVVDQYGHVHGIENLRICDQSIFPTMTSRGPNATTIMVGERMSAFFNRPDSG